MGRLTGIPYQGSKGQSAPRIFRAIQQRHPEASTLVDPFCGGFAVSEYFLQQGWQVQSSDADRYLVALLNQTLGGLPDSVDEWVTRERFEACRDSPESTGFDDWYIGYVRIIWSFGNSGTSYLFGRGKVEGIKRFGHRLVVEAKTSKNQLIPEEAQSAIAALPNRRIRRRALRTVVGRLRRSYELTHLKQLQHLERLERLDRLQNLQNLSQLERLESLKMSGPVALRDYREALSEVPSDAVVYLDPPYEGTEGYRGSGGGFDHNEFWERVRRIGETHPVYVSEYSAPDDFIPILSWTRTNDMAADSRGSRAREKLFTLVRDG